MLNVLIFSVLGVYSLVGLGGLAMDRKFFAHLRDHHRSVWEQLGSPTLLSMAYLGPHLTVRRFVREKRYLALGDPELNRLARIHQYTNTAAYGLFAIVLLLFFFGKSLGL